MGEKILIIADKNLMVLEAVINALQSVGAEYETCTKALETVNGKFEHIILINKIIEDTVLDKVLKEEGKIIYISNKAEKIQSSKSINYIKTDLLEDTKEYGIGEKDFEFRKGIYSILNKQLLYLLSEETKDFKGIVIDLCDCKPKYTNSIFEFESINESYRWLTKKLQEANQIKEIAYYMERIYDDSNKEIEYLIERLKIIKEGCNNTQIFLCSKEEVKRLQNNMFFKLILENQTKENVLYIADKEKVKGYLKERYDVILYGIIIYGDCVYRDYLDNEYTLGYVDCKQETIKMYEGIFDEIIENVAVKLEKEEDIYGLFE